MKKVGGSYPIQPMFDDDDNFMGHQYVPKIKGDFKVNGIVTTDRPFKLDDDDLAYKAISDMAKQMTSVAKKAIMVKRKDSTYELNEEERVALAIGAGCKFDTKMGVHNTIQFIVENVGIEWNGETFQITQFVGKDGN